MDVSQLHERALRIVYSLLSTSMDVSQVTRESFKNSIQLTIVHLYGCFTITRESIKNSIQLTIVHLYGCFTSYTREH